MYSCHSNVNNPSLIQAFTCMSQQTHVSLALLSSTWLRHSFLYFAIAAVGFHHLSHSFLRVYKEMANSITTEIWRGRKVTSEEEDEHQQSSRSRPIPKQLHQVPRKAQALSSVFLSLISSHCNIVYVELLINYCTTINRVL